MSDIGIIPVDWEDRFDPQRMLRERLDRAKEALDNWKRTYYSYFVQKMQDT